jgi:Tol biopolymer transport system component
VTDSPGTRVSGVHAVNSGRALLVYRSDHTLVERSQFLGAFSAQGVAIVESHDVTIAGSTIRGNAFYGIDAFADVGLTLRDSTVAGNVIGIHAGDGDYMGPEGGDTVTVTGSAIFGNSQDGIAADRIALTVGSSRVYRNGRDGIAAAHACETVVNSRIFSNGRDGIRVDPRGGEDCPASLGHRFEGNSVYRNRGDGISLINNSRAAVISENVVERNGGDGIRVGFMSGYDLEPQWLTGGRVAFVSTRGHDRALYSARADGTDVRRITAPGTVVGQYEASADGTKLAFLERGRLYVMNADGSAKHSVSPPGIAVDAFEWSRDGSTFALLSGLEVYKIAAGETGEAVLVASLDRPVVHFFLSPDGEQIGLLLAEGVGRDLYLGPTDGSGTLQRLTTAHSVLGTPAWSPDGSRISYTTSSGLGESTDLHLVKPDGSDDRIADTAGGFCYPGDAVWSPDGSKLAVVCGLAVWTIDSDGTNPRLVFNGNSPENQSYRSLAPLAWSQDGSQIAFGFLPLLHAESTSDFRTPFGKLGEVLVVGLDGRLVGHVVNARNPLVTIARNSANFNRAIGIDAVRDVVDGGGNTAAHNKGPAQCVNVACAAKTPKK